jgi:hypothetical protein
VSGSAAPITADGKVIIANSAGDGKTRGWIAALSARARVVAMVRFRAG